MKKWKPTSIAVVTITAAPIIVATIPSASAQDCSRFDRAKTEATAALTALDAQLARYKETGREPEPDASVCSAARQLKAKSATAAALATSTCDPNHTVDAVNHMRSGADADISVFCAPSAGKSGQSQSMRPRTLIGGPSSVAPRSGKIVTPRSLCGRLPGTWEWFMNGDVTIQPNGTAIQSASGLTGSWSCNNRSVIFHWSHGFVDSLTLSTDGNHLTGGNGISPVWGNRKGI